MKLNKLELWPKLQRCYMTDFVCEVAPRGCSSWTILLAKERIFREVSLPSKVGLDLTS